MIWVYNILLDTRKFPPVRLLFYGFSKGAREGTWSSRQNDLPRHRDVLVAMPLMRKNSRQDTVPVQACFVLLLGGGEPEHEHDTQEVAA